MDEAERCGRVGYIYNSKLTIQGTPAELKALPEVSPSGTRRIAVAIPEPAKALAALKQENFALDATLVEAEIHLLLPNNVSDADVTASLAGVGITDISIRPIEPSLEDVFVTVTRRLEKS